MGEKGKDYGQHCYMIACHAMSGTSNVLYNITKLLDYSMLVPARPSISLRLVSPITKSLSSSTGAGGFPTFTLQPDVSSDRRLV